ncbi:MAG: hypothetical protein ACRD0A_06310 [Acidimicrobiales bacterium]
MTTSTSSPATTVAGVGPRTLRSDAWWAAPLVTVFVLGGFVVYATWAALANANYYADPYLSPLYSPCLASNCAHTTWPIVGDWWTLSPALLILPIPLGFRLTCYYYRKAYYRAFFWSPPACAVRDARASYHGESRFPLLLQNVHRYFFYLTIPFPLILLWDGLRAFGFPDGFGMGLGTVILLVNAGLLGAYTLSCHSCRHVCGGYLDLFSRSPVRFRLWRFVSRLNARHMPIAWVSLVGVAATDLYVRLVASGAIHDPRFF